MKKLLTFGAFVFLVFTIGAMLGTYGLLQSGGTGKTDFGVGKWNITVNDLDIIARKTITADDLVYFGNANVEPGHFAPGVSTGYEIVIDAHNTDVAIRYDITIDAPQLEEHENIELLVTGDVVRKDTVEGIIYSGIIPLSAIRAGQKTTIHTGLTWIEDDRYDELDSRLIGGEPLQIKIEIKFTQYLGEEL